METAEPLDFGATPPESEGLAVRSPTLTPISIYATLLCSTQAPPSPTPTISAINCNSIFPNPAIVVYAFGQGAHPAPTATQVGLGQSTMSRQAPISSPTIDPSPPFDSHLDPADIEFLKKKLS